MKLAIRQILLESVSFKHTKPDFLSLPADKPSQSEVGLSAQALYSEDRKDVAVRLRVVSDAPEAPYTYDVSYLTLLSVDYEGEPPPADLEKRLLVTGGSMAMPFVRELVANLSSRARLGTTWVEPVNFDKLAPDTPPAAPATVAAR